MNTFLKTYRLALTPLSPIHIGCGEDFEPTNYVIDGGLLYGFDPSRAVLNELERGKLMAARQTVCPLIHRQKAVSGSVHQGVPASPAV